LKREKCNYNYFIKLISVLLFSIFFGGCFFFPYGSLYVTSNPSGAQIFLNDTDTGMVTPALITNLYQGSYTIMLTLDNPPLSRTESVVITQKQTTSAYLELFPEAEYRALCVGVDKYKDPGITDLYAPSFDVSRMIQIFRNTRFGDGKTIFSVLNTLIGEQATHSNIIQEISSSFSQANDNDVSYFYFSGHGWSNGVITTILPYDAIIEDYSMDITVEELAAALGKISGTKVVIIDSCYSGGFIGKELPSRGGMNLKELQTLNTSILESFALYNLKLAKGNLASEGFQVIVSASGDQKCFETTRPHPIDGYPYGYFSAFFCDGCGYNDFIFPYPADINLDYKVTLNEIYQHIYSSLAYLEQDVQVFPQNSSFNLIEY